MSTTFELLHTVAISALICVCLVQAIEDREQSADEIKELETAMDELEQVSKAEADERESELNFL